MRLVSIRFVPPSKIGAINKVIATNHCREQRDDLGVIHMGIKPKPLEPLLKSALRPQGRW
jgi:hypothetical protein